MRPFAALASSLRPVLVLAAALAPAVLPAWSEPHLSITRAAVEVLPAWQREALGAEAGPLGASYCLIPDNVYSDKANARFAMMDDRPKDVYLLNLHLPAQLPENLETLRYFTGKAVAAVRAGDMASAARYMGTVCHQLEDYGSPAHTVPGDNMFTLLQQFLPPTEPMKDKLLHSPIESGELPVSITGYRPRLLGETVDEAAWRLLQRVNEGIINARSTTIPIIQALYAQDAEGVRSHQQRAARFDAEVVADALYTILCLGTAKFVPEEQAALRRVPIAAFWPLEAASLCYPQSQFFSSPHWGHPRSGVILAGGNQARPLRLRVDGPGGVAERDFSEGISAGMGRSLTFPLPKGVYTRFTVLAGLHPELGAQGRVEFTVSGDGKPLASVIIDGSQPAKAIECDVSGVSELRLTLTSRGPNAKSQYAIWAEPTLAR